jgi:hypothetical protein
MARARLLSGFWESGDSGRLACKGSIREIMKFSLESGEWS